MSLHRLLLELPTAFRRAGDKVKAEVFTALPARVKTYDAATQTADLEIVVRAPLFDDIEETDIEHEALPVIPNVRVLFPSTGTMSITWPIAEGDEVLFVVSSLALGEYRRTGQPSDALDVRRNDLGCGGWAIPGVMKDSALLPTAETNALVLKQSTAIELEAPEIRVGKDATDPIANGTKVDTELTAIATSIGQIAGILNAPGPVSGAPGSVTLYTPNAVGAPKGKVES
ncbi:MAG: hypothetical protein JNL21_27660 [Myxococcales bacterium]|nr:hypothetical protein [Myxococcales bacterium]